MSEIMKAVIDRFEEEYAVVMLEDGRAIDIPKNQLPADVYAGCHLNVRFDKAQRIETIQMNEEATMDARKRIQEKLERLRRNEHLNSD